MSASFTFWDAVLPHTGLLAVAVLLGGILAIARRTTEPVDRRRRRAHEVADRHTVTDALPLRRYTHRTTATPCPSRQAQTGRSAGDARAA